MGMGTDLGFEDPTQRYIDLRRSGVPADVAAAIINNPSYGEGEYRGSGWPNTYGGREYRSGGGKGMPGMPWDDPGAAGMGTGLTPDMIKRIQMYQALMGGGRGAGGMQLNPNTQNLTNQLSNPGQQGGLMAMIMQNPQLLQWFMQQQQGGPGAFPQGGGSVTLAQLLGAPQQATGQPT